MGNAFLSHIREADAIWPGDSGVRRPGCDARRWRRQPGERHRDHRDRADLGRPADGGEGAAAAGEGSPDQQRQAGSAWLSSRLRRCSKAGRTIFAAGLDRGPLRDLFPLTAKPFLYVFNCDSDELANEPLKQRLRALVAPAEAIFLDAKIESELVEMEPDEAREFLAEMDVAEPGWTSWLASASTHWACRPF